MRSTELWVFGYGSLIWQPGFPYMEAVPGVLDGYARRFCMWSVQFRGSQQSPGLVLALKQEAGASCHGLTYRVSVDRAGPVLAQLRERELVLSAYRETRETVVLGDGRTVAAVCFVIDPTHELYCGELSADEQARIISRASGTRGDNREYLYWTCAHLDRLGLSDPELTALEARVRKLTP
ncbi:MAG: gamma-glutamylcyclotransferase [Paracoccaceae bacterium]|nr:gamma-glutamylcyclotransferase [Paracoccaceae bacterium]